jgi:hypothetical protein
MLGAVSRGVKASHREVAHSGDIPHLTESHAGGQMERCLQPTRPVTLSHSRPASGLVTRSDTERSNSQEHGSEWGSHSDR